MRLKTERRPVRVLHCEVRLRAACPNCAHEQVCLVPCYLSDTSGAELLGLLAGDGVGVPCPHCPEELLAAVPVTEGAVLDLTGVQGQ